MDILNKPYAKEDERQGLAIEPNTNIGAVEDARKQYTQEAVSILTDTLNRPTNEVNKILGNFSSHVTEKLFSFADEEKKKEINRSVFREVLSIRDAIRPEFNEQANLAKIFESSLEHAGLFGTSQVNTTLREYSFASPMVRAIVEAIPGEYSETSKAFSKAAESFIAEKAKPLSVRGILNVTVPGAVRLAGEFAATRKVTGILGLGAGTTSKIYQSHPYLYNALQSGTTFAAHDVLFNPEGYKEPVEKLASVGESFATGAALGAWGKLLGNKPLLRIADSVVISPAIFGGLQAAKDIAKGEEGDRVIENFANQAVSVGVFNAVNSIFGIKEQKEQFEKQKTSTLEKLTSDAMKLRGFEIRENKWVLKKNIKPILTTSKTDKNPNEIYKETYETFESIYRGATIKKLYALKDYQRILERREAKNKLDKTGQFHLDLLRQHLSANIDENIKEADKLSDNFIERSVSIAKKEGVELTEQQKKERREKFFTNLIEEEKVRVQRASQRLYEDVSFKDKIIDDIIKMTKEIGGISRKNIKIEIDNLSKLNAEKLLESRETIAKIYTAKINNDARVKIGMNEEEFKFIKNKTKNDLVVKDVLSNINYYYGENKLPLDKGLRRSIIGTSLVAALEKKGYEEKLLGKSSRINLPSMVTSMRYYIREMGEKIGSLNLGKTYERALDSIGRAQNISLKIAGETAKGIGETAVTLESLDATSSGRIIDHLFMPNEKNWTILSDREKKIASSIKDTLQNKTAKFVRGVRFYSWVERNNSNIKKLIKLERKIEDKQLKDVNYNIEQKDLDKINSLRKQLEDSAPKNWNYEVNRNDEVAETGKPYTANLYRGINPEGPSDAGYYGKATYYTPDSVEAKRYAGDDGKVIKQNITLQNPFVGTERDFKQFNTVIETAENIGEYSNLSAKSITENMKQAGYDGFVVLYSEGHIREVGVFESKKEVNWNVSEKYKDIEHFLKTHLKALDMGEENFLKFLEGEKWGTREHYYMTEKELDGVRDRIEQLLSPSEFRGKKKDSNLLYTDIEDSFAKPRKSNIGPERNENPFVAMVRHVDTVARSFYLFPHLKTFYSELSKSPLSQNDVNILNEFSRNLTGRYRRQDPVTALASTISNVGWKYYFMKPSNILYFGARQPGNIMLQMAQLSNYEFAKAMGRMALNKKETGDFLNPETRKSFERYFTTLVSQKGSIYQTLTMQDLSRASIEGDLAGRAGPMALRLTRIGQIIVPKIDDLMRMMWIPSYEIARNNLELYKEKKISYDKLVGRLKIRTFSNNQISELNSYLVSKNFEEFSSKYATWKTENSNFVYNKLGRTPAEQFASAGAWLGLSTFNRGIFEMYWQNGVRPFLRGIKTNNYKMSYDGIVSMLKTATHLALTSEAMKRTIGFRGPFAEYGPLSSAIITGPASLGTSILGGVMESITSVIQILQSDKEFNSKIDKIGRLGSRIGEMFIPLCDVFINISRDANDKESVRLFDLVKEAFTKYEIKGDESKKDYYRTTTEKFQDLLFGTKGFNRENESEK